MEPEHKEILLWAGGAILLLLVGLWFIWDVRAEVKQTTRHLKGAYPKYQTFYQEDPDKLDSAAAQAWREKLRDEQLAALRKVEAEMLIKLPSTVPLGNDYQGAVAWTKERIITPLKNRARRQNLALVGQLPYEDSKDLQQDEQVLQMQILQVYAMGRVLNQLMDHGPRRIDECSLNDWQTDDDQAYIVLPFFVSLVADNEVLERILLDLNSGDRGLHARQISIQPEGPQLYRLAMIVCVAVKYQERFGRLPEAAAPPPPKRDRPGSDRPGSDDPPKGGGRGAARRGSDDEEP